jgi:hydrogenase maturation protease
MTQTASHRGLLVIGIGNPLREDDAVGLYLVERLQKHFGANFHGMVVYEPDIALAETIAAHRTVLIVDALAAEKELPFRLTPLPAAATIFPSGGLSSHVFDWGMLLAMARDLFGHLPEAFICGIRAHCFGIAEELSPQCRADAEAAFSMLCEFTVAHS